MNRNSNVYQFVSKVREWIKKRYISEWQHVSRGATWIRHAKNCLVASYEQCFKGASNWKNVSLAEFMSCQHNVASNRQTRMLASYDADLTRCANDDHHHNSPVAAAADRDDELLRRAKQTLESMPFFAINEYQHLSQLLFEHAFGRSVFKFEVDLHQSNRSLADEFLRDHFNQTVVQQIKQLNRLDFELYSFAVNLFFDRLKFFHLL